MAKAPIAIPVANDAPTAERMPETRAWFVEPSKAFTPESIRQMIERAARAGFNTVVFPIYNNGFTFFPSESAKEINFNTINPNFKSWNPLHEAAAATEELGLSLWGFARPYNFHPRYSTVSHRLLDRFPKWSVKAHPSVKSARARRRENYMACPVNPDYRRYLGDVLSEVVSSYPIDGLVLNYTGYSLRKGNMKDYPYCFCDACRHEYNKQTGEELIADASDSISLELIRQWQFEVSVRSLEYLRQRTLKWRRTLRLICRAQPQWRWAVDETGTTTSMPYSMNWDALIDAGIAEVLLIDHDDETSPELFRTRLVSDLAKLHDEALILPAVYVQTPTDLEEPIKAVRRYPVSGFLAEFADPMTDEQADFIRENYLSEPARSPDSSPLLSVAFLLGRVQKEHIDNPLISDFMRDFLRLIEIQIRGHMSFESLEMIFQNLGGLQAGIRRGRLGVYKIPESTMRELALARKIVRLALLDCTAEY